METIGVLHPGAMGSAVVAALTSVGHRVLWASEGRSESSRERAIGAGAVDSGSVGEMARACEILISVVPPHAATEVAVEVARCEFRGIYVDANAVAPSTAERIAATFSDSGVSYVDGSLIGPPPIERGDTRLYLSGEHAARVASLFDGSVLDARVMDDAGPFAASAIKMCFAAWTKGTAALLWNAVLLARAEGVESALLAEWGESIPDLVSRASRFEARAGEKAWRFVGEMEEIARSFGDAGLPSGFHAAAADVYRAIADAAAEQRKE